MMINDDYTYDDDNDDSNICGDDDNNLDDDDNHGNYAHDDDEDNDEGGGTFLCWRVSPGWPRAPKGCLQKKGEGNFLVLYSPENSCPDEPRGL